MAYFCHPFQLFRVFNTKEHKIDNNFDEKEMISEGYLPVYDDGQTLIY